MTKQIIIASENGTPSAIEQVNTKHSTLNTKCLVNGILYIEHDGKLYNAQGGEFAEY